MARARRGRRSRPKLVQRHVGRRFGFVPVRDELDAARTPPAGVARHDAPFNPRVLARLVTRWHPLVAGLDDHENSLLVIPAANVANPDVHFGQEILGRDGRIVVAYDDRDVVTVVATDDVAVRGALN